MRQVPALTAGELDKAAALFRNFDANADGVLDLNEFAMVMDKLCAITGASYAQEQIAAMFRQADLDASGVIDFNEFLFLQKRRQDRGEPSLESRRGFPAKPTPRHL